MTEIGTTRAHYVTLLQDLHEWLADQLASRNFDVVTELQDELEFLAAMATRPA